MVTIMAMMVMIFGDEAIGSVTVMMQMMSGQIYQLKKLQ